MAGRVTEAAGFIRGIWWTLSTKQCWPIERHWLCSRSLIWIGRCRTGRKAQRILPTRIRREWDCLPSQWRPTACECTRPGPNQADIYNKSRAKKITLAIKMKWALVHFKAGGEEKKSSKIFICLSTFLHDTQIRVFSNITHNSPIHCECQTQSAKVLAQPWKRARQDDSNSTPHPTNFGIHHRLESYDSP